MILTRSQRPEVGGQCSAVIVGGSASDERPDGWADPIAEWICDLYGVKDHRLERSGFEV